LIFYDIDQKQGDEAPSLPSSPGTYILILELETRTSIAIGKLGKRTFEPGFYFYIGSAFGPGGLQARVNRHRKSIKKLRWHIDYLRRFCILKEIWFSTNSMSLECTWSGVFSRFRLSESPMKKFGSSDCDCFSHLFYSKKKPIFQIFRTSWAGL